MRLSRLKIENFRGISELEIEFERDMTVIIGENNTGKTSILEALRFGLDAIKSNRSFNFSEYDFYRDDEYTDLSTCSPISFIFTFKETREYPWPDHITQTLSDIIVGSDHSTIKLKVVASYDSENNELVQNFYFLDDSDNEMTGKNGSIKDLRLLRPFFFQTALRAAKDEFHGQSTYWASFIKHRDISDNEKQELEQELYEVNRKIVDAHTSFQDITEEVKQIAKLVTVGGENPVSVDPVTPDIYKTLRYTEVNLLTNSNAKIPIRSHGEGTQSLSVLLLFSAYLKKRLQPDTDRNAEPIIAIEEPEAHLHPNAVRAIWHLLEDLPGQKIIATHSGDILSEIPIEKVRRLSRQDQTIKCSLVPDDLLSDEEMRKFNHHVRRNRGELLFSKTWLLVEGETDVSVFSECADILGFDLNHKGVRIVECSQTGGPGIFIKVADAMGINWHLVADNDGGGEKYIESAKELLEDREETSFITKLSHPNIDVLLCCNGFGTPYRQGVGPQKEAELTEPEESDGYWLQVYKIINKKRGFSKPAAALESLFMIRDRGDTAVPEEIKSILEKL